MLNRRILRIKAMQALYSYYLLKESLKEVVKDELVAQFEIDPAKHDFAEKEEFVKRQRFVQKLFSTHVDAGKVMDTENVEVDILKATNEHILRYQNQLDNERKSIGKSMMAEVEGIMNVYLKLLLLLPEFSFLEKQEKDKQDKAHLRRQSYWNYNLINNSLIEHLATFPPLVKMTIDKKIDWKNELDQLRTWYKDLIRKDDEMMTYQGKTSPTAEEHETAALSLIKRIIFKNDSINEFLAEMDLHWSENKTIVRSMVQKTLQSYDPEADDQFELKSLSMNPEEDFDFFKKIYKETLTHDQQLDKVIGDKTKNWDVSRIAMTDKIILKMALAEMMTFPSIPIKVTINEYIEVSKQYSTPKSKQFINGILDVLANELTSEGVIKKSGRGLIDNK
ncbi:MAG: transcription antitermination factor NusB [Cyclobacteriaceae bacterium]|nr:transcription antitermination factor NusB [Cyclobacteriaceae bacterium HetDA_MAG_MS6]